MASETEIANLALSHLGVSKEIADLTSENSKEANAINRFYDQALDMALLDFPWPFAIRFADLALVEDDPTDEWAYSYRVPSGCLLVRRILSGIRQDSRSTRIEYIITSDDSGKLIYTNMTDATVEYTARITNTEIYPPDFMMAFSMRLAAYAAPRITGGDAFGLMQKVLQLYRYELTRAQANQANEEARAGEIDSELILARE